MKSKYYKSIDGNVYLHYEEVEYHLANVKVSKSGMIIVMAWEIVDFTPEGLTLLTDDEFEDWKVEQATLFQLLK